jgi:hypothetical protein
MKLSSSIICFLVFLFTGITNVFSQAPQKFKYQSIARNASGLELASSPIGIRFSIRDLSASGTIVYQETHAVTTNTFGLFSINVGEGTASIGTIGSVDWANGSKYL